MEELKPNHPTLNLHNRLTMKLNQFTADSLKKLVLRLISQGTISGSEDTQVQEDITQNISTKDLHNIQLAYTLSHPKATKDDIEQIINYVYHGLINTLNKHIRGYLKSHMEEKPLIQIMPNPSNHLTQIIGYSYTNPDDPTYIAYIPEVEVIANIIRIPNRIILNLIYL